MKVSEVMTRGVEVIHPQSGLPQAAMTMRTLDVGALPVVKEGRLEGIVTDRDIAVRAVAESRDLAVERKAQKAAGTALEGVSEPGRPRR